ncbi:MAG: hypothetical protein U0840_13830 [Gemmataceae bacterium]
MIICQGCGHSFDLPEGYTRNKTQCPACGVICAVPAGAPTSARKSRPPAPPAEEDPFQPENPEPEPIPLFDEDPAPAPRKKTANPPRASNEATITCRRCGKKIRKQRECPVCDAAEPTSPAVPVMELDAPPSPEDDEDASPYDMADKDVRSCPQCNKALVLGAVVCNGCGYDLRSRRKFKRTYEPLARAWETDMPLEKRLIWFGVGQGVHWVLAILAGLTGGSVVPFFFAWPLMTLLLSFVLGTYERLELTRDTRGRSRCVKRWRALFIPLEPETIDLRGYEGVTTGQWHDAGFIEWFVFASLLTMGVIPGLIYGYQAIYKNTYHVALALDHGHSEVYLYRGRSEEQMNAIAEAVCGASGLPRLV